MLITKHKRDVMSRYREDMTESALPSAHYHRSSQVTKCAVFAGLPMRFNLPSVAFRVLHKHLLKIDLMRMFLQGECADLCT